MNSLFLQRLWGIYKWQISLLISNFLIKKPVNTHTHTHTQSHNMFLRFGFLEGSRTNLWKLFSKKTTKSYHVSAATDVLLSQAHVAGSTVVAHLWGSSVFSSTPWDILKDFIQLSSPSRTKWELADTSLGFLVWDWISHSDIQEEFISLPVSCAIPLFCRLMPPLSFHCPS